MHQHVRIDKDGATLLDAPLETPPITDAAQIRSALARITYTVHFHDEKTGETLTFQIKQLRAGEGMMFWKDFYKPNVIKAIESKASPEELSQVVQAEMGIENEAEILTFFQELKPKVIAQCMVDEALQDVEFWEQVNPKWINLLYDVITDSIEPDERDEEINRLTAALAEAQTEIAALKERIAELEGNDGKDTP